MFERHIGFGARANVDVEVEFYPSRRIVHQHAVSSNSVIEIREGGELSFADGFQGVQP